MSDTLRSVYHARKTGRFTDETAVSVAEEMTRLDPDGRGVTARAFHFSQIPETAPLHSEFEWDDRVCGLLHRDEQARHLIGCVVIIAERESSEPITVRAFLAVDDLPQDEGGSQSQGACKVYKPVQVIAERPDDLGQVIAYAEAQLKGWRERFGAYSTVCERFQPVLDAIDKVLPPEREAA